jgi:hypothetical protein
MHSDGRGNLWVMVVLWEMVLGDVDWKKYVFCYA